MSEGLKYDNGKRQWSLLEAELIEPLIEVFEAGVKKYGRDNWKKGFEDRENRFFDALQRHAWAAKGKPLARDEETGCYHKAQVAWNALVDLWYERRQEKVRSSKEVMEEMRRRYPHLLKEINES